MTARQHQSAATSIALAGSLVEREIVPVLLSLGLVGLVTMALAAAHDVLQVVNLVSIVYLIPVLIAANRWGIVAATTAALAGGAAADYFFYPPLYSFEIDDPQNLADLAVYLIVAFVTSDLANRRKRSAEALRRSNKELESLYGFSRQLATCFTVPDLIAATETYLSETLGSRAYLLGPKDIEQELPGNTAIPQKVRRRAAAMIAQDDGHAHTISNPDLREAWLIRVVPAMTAGYAAIVNLGPGSRETIEVRSRRVDRALEEVAVTLARLGVENALETVKLRVQSEALRDALIGSVSHELRSPLASILGSVSVLERMPAIKDDTSIRSLLESVDDQAARLDNDIQYLLSAARVTAQGAPPRREWADPGDIVNAAGHKTTRLAAHRVELEIAADLPLVHVNSALIEQALGQLLENAAKYSPAGSAIRISASTDGN